MIVIKKTTYFMQNNIFKTTYFKTAYFKKQFIQKSLLYEKQLITISF